MTGGGEIRFSGTGRIRQATPEIVDALSRSGSPEYHTVFNVRRYDLVNLREDMDQIPTGRRWLPVWASLAFAVALAGFGAAIAGNASTPVAPYSLRAVYMTVGIIGVLVAVAFFVIDQRDQNREEMTVGLVKKRMDGLIAMFDQKTDDPKPRSLAGTSGADPPPGR